jgi:alpha-ketoglutarate-dependent taurine dioxygenase
MRTVLNPEGPDEVLAALADRGWVTLRRTQGFTQSEFVDLGNAIMMPRAHHPLVDEREVVDEDRTTTTVTRGSAGIALHREASYAPGSPDILMFLCERPAGSGGETILCDGSELLAALPSDVRDFANGTGIRWANDIPDGRWQAMLGTDDPEQALAIAANWRPPLRPWESLSFEFTGQTITMTLHTRCVTTPLFGAMSTFCNSVLIMSPQPADGYLEDRLRLRLDDGSPFPVDLLAAISRTAEQCTEPVRWRAGDVVVVDNTRAMHGRRAFTDPARRILVRMGYLHPALVPDPFTRPGAATGQG